MLFHNPDFQNLRHPKFWNTEKSTLTEKQRQRNRSRSNSISRVEDVYSMQGSDDSESSFFKNQKQTKYYVSKKKKALLEKEMEQALAELKSKREKRLKEEEEYGWSKHVHQLQHMADICEDYNYLVDTLEDEHVKRTVHTIIHTEDAEANSAKSSISLESKSSG